MTQRIIVWDDAWHNIEVNGFLLHLTPTQYRIMRMFAESLPSTVAASEETVVLAYRSRRKLEAETEVSHAALSRHISDLNARLQAQGLHLSFFQEGYLLTFTSRQSTTFRDVFLSREKKLR